MQADVALEFKRVDLSNCPGASLRLMVRSSLYMNDGVATGRTGHAQLSLLHNRWGKRRTRSFNPVDLTKQPSSVLHMYWLAGFTFLQIHN